MTQAELQDLAAELATIYLRLEAIHDRLPESPNEPAMQRDEQENDIATALLSTITAVFCDHLAPILSNLKDAALHEQQQPDVPVLSLAGAPPRAFAADRQAVSLLAGVVAQRVAERGGCILDLRQFGLSSETAHKIAALAGLSVSVGWKAVFTPSDQEPAWPA